VTKSPSIAELRGLARRVYPVGARKIEVYRGARPMKWIARVLWCTRGLVWDIPLCVSGASDRTQAKRALAAALRELGEGK
jgi:hypothetical protein